MFDRTVTSEDAINVIVDALTTENMEPKVAKYLLKKVVEHSIRLKEKEEEA